MPTKIEAHLPPLAPSASMDGLGLTPAEIRSLTPETFTRVFTLPSFDHVPIVGAGYLKRRPPGAPWWLRFRARPKTKQGSKGRSKRDSKNRSKDRQTDAWQVVFRSPVYAPPEAGGGVVIATGTITLKAKDLEGAKAEALITIARAQRKSIRASTWPIERIERLRCYDLLQKYLDIDLKPRKDRKETKAERKYRQTYSAALQAFQRAFPTLEVGDCKGRIDLDFADRTGHKPTSCYAELKTVQKALNEILTRIGVPITYRVDFVNKDPGALDKVNWTPAEYDRVLASAEGFLHHPDGTPVLVLGPNGLVQARKRPEPRKAWRRMIEFLVYSVSRNGQIYLTRWVGPEVEPAGRPFAAGEERPWLEVLDDCIIFHRDGDQRYDGNKKHGPNIVPREIEPEVRAWYAEDMAKGIEFVFHKEDGDRYGVQLPSWTFRQIIGDAGLPAAKRPHHLKDLAVAWADAAGVPRSTLSKHADTSEQMLERKYGPSLPIDVLEAAAEQITQKSWREKGLRGAAGAAAFVARRDGARAAAIAAKTAARKAAKKGKSRELADGRQDRARRDRACRDRVRPDHARRDRSRHRTRRRRAGRPAGRAAPRRRRRWRIGLTRPRTPTRAPVAPPSRVPAAARKSRAKQWLPRPHRARRGAPRDDPERIGAAGFSPFVAARSPRPRFVLGKPAESRGTCPFQAARHKARPSIPSA